ETDRQHNSGGGEKRRVTLARDHALEAAAVRTDRVRAIRRAAATVGIEQRLDEPIRIIVGLRERLPRGDAPELAWFDPVEIDQFVDPFAKLRQQGAILVIRLEIIADALVGKKIGDGAVIAIRTA